MLLIFRNDKNNFSGDYSSLKYRFWGHLNSIGPVASTPRQPQQHKYSVFQTTSEGRLLNGENEPNFVSTETGTDDSITSHI